ncbi:MAG: GNAT family N-acetyltransferase [Lachnospiraceae bacterium]|nr:GNAT family N-acetyltransferase [Lachnospiraceae bacterium]
MPDYRKLNLSEADRIAEIDATHYIKNAWRRNEASGQYELVEINWTDTELPNGFDWHLQRLKETLQNGGTAFGCFEGSTLIGYTTVDKDIFGKQEKYVLLDQLFVSQNCRGKGIGKALFLMCAKQAAEYGAEKLFLCAGSAENTIAFYQKLGCQTAKERNQRLYEEDPRDIQLEYCLETKKSGQQDYVF